MRAGEELVTLPYLKSGAEVSVTGERGAFTYQSLRINRAGDIEVTVWGGPAGRHRTRVFAADRIVVAPKRSDA